MVSVGYWVDIKLAQLADTAGAVGDGGRAAEPSWR